MACLCPRTSQICSTHPISTALGQGHDVFIAIGRRLSWCLLLSVQVASGAATIGTWLAGINPIWTLLFAVLAIVFLHGCLRVRSDEARLRREYFQQIIQRRQSGEKHSRKRRGSADATGPPTGLLLSSS